MDRHTLVALALGAAMGHFLWQGATACEVHFAPRPDVRALSLVDVSPGFWHPRAEAGDWPADATFVTSQSALILGDGTRLELQ